MSRKSPLSAILIGGGIAGALDITYAVVFSWARSGVPPSRILQSVASGLLGAPAFQGGLPIAVMGLMLHFCIALLWATIFFGVSRAVTILTRHPVVFGVLYGLLIYAVMNLAVLPLSAFPRKVTFPPIVLATGLFVHMFFIGLPIALAISRLEPRKPNPGT
ncbi:MAG: hypothetical protein H0X40_01665 [Chthoniobacterales bacterium]|nr:hypothetical protein [Chthoniobacterales bacterium]